MKFAKTAFILLFWLACPLSNLQSLDLDSNKLKETIPVLLDNPSNLFPPYLQVNQRTGNIPGINEALPAQRGILQTTNEPGRTGAYYLPEGYNLRPLPLMLAYHGQGGNGDGILGAFVSLADEYHFIIVAPDSRWHSGYGYTWEVGDRPGEITPDYRHALACMDEVAGFPFVAVNPGHVLAVGHSAGGSSAPYMATNSSRFTASATLHGGVFTGGLGGYKIPAWFSTGESDTLRTPTHVKGQADSMRNAGFPDVVFHVYPGGHELIANEIRDMVTWWIGPPSAIGSPFGRFETPVNGSTVRSSVPVTGWTLDDVEVKKVEIWRDPVTGETPGLWFIGDAVFVKGARPDIETGYPGYPFKDRAGWGYMLLTNFLPAQGNGTFKLYAYATDKEGNRVLLGTKTIICDNAHAVKPFGAIDTPAQGGDASGNPFVNFGWVLTPLPKTVPKNGSTIEVYVDGAKVGNLATAPNVYNQYRVDVATAFPGLKNSGGPVGAFYLDTTKYANGVHTIHWIATDDAGAADGIGSRYFNIINTGTATQASQELRYLEIADLYESIMNIPVSFEPIKAMRGFSLKAKPESLMPDNYGTFHVEIREVERIELELGKGRGYRGYFMVGEELRSLPIGSTLDQRTGHFSWMPGPGFLGTYDLVFIKEDGLGMTNSIPVKVTIRPKFDKD